MPGTALCRLGTYSSHPGPIVGSSWLLVYVSFCPRHLGCFHVDFVHCYWFVHSTKSSVKLYCSPQTLIAVYTLIQQQQERAKEHLIEADSIGSFYKFVNKRLSTRTGIPPLTDKNDKLVTDDYTKARMFNDYFVSVGRADMVLYQAVIYALPCVWIVLTLKEG